MSLQGAAHGAFTLIFLHRTEREGKEHREEGGGRGENTKIRREDCEELEVRDRQAPGGKDNGLLTEETPQEWPARVPSIQKGTLKSKEGGSGKEKKKEGQEKESHREQHLGFSQTER